MCKKMVELVRSNTYYSSFWKWSLPWNRSWCPCTFRTLSCCRFGWSWRSRKPRVCRWTWARRFSPSRSRPGRTRWWLQRCNAWWSSKPQSYPIPTHQIWQCRCPEFIQGLALLTQFIQLLVFTMQFGPLRIFRPNSCIETRILGSKACFSIIQTDLKY